VQTVDVITPIADDPGDFGYIAAINAMSDVYAMGGTPLTALTFLAFDACSLPVQAASRILSGAGEALDEASCTLVGGHTVEDAEIKFGLSVTGTVHPEKYVTNAGARDGDLIYLTKPLGTGIASTALKGELLPEDLQSEFIDWMKRSNSDPSSAMIKAGVTAATDVTGFGLLGHLWEMCQGANLGAVVDVGAVPLMTGIIEMVDMGMVPAGAYRNRDYLSPHVSGSAIAESKLLPLYDPQTSGGLLIAVDAARAEDLEKAMGEKGVTAHRVGAFRKGRTIKIVED
jgi:selenide,water dikinase